MESSNSLRSSAYCAICQDYYQVKDSAVSGKSYARHVQKSKEHSRRLKILEEEEREPKHFYWRSDDSVESGDEVSEGDNGLSEFERLDRRREEAKDSHSLVSSYDMEVDHNNVGECRNSDIVGGDVDLDIDGVNGDDCNIRSRRECLEDCVDNVCLENIKLMEKSFYLEDPVSFNKVGKAVVDVDTALNVLAECEALQLSESESNKLIDLLFRVVENHSSKPFAFPKTFVTLKKAVFGKIDKALPLNEVTLKILPQYFKDEDEEKLPPVLAKYIPLEVCLAELFLRMDPRKIVKEMKEEFVTFEDGSREREC